MDIQQEVEEVKKELVRLIIKHLRENKLPAEKAKKLAGDFLNVLPIDSQQDLLEKLKNLGINYQEAKELYVDELKKISEEQKDQTLSKMRDHIQNGNIDQAIEAARKISSGAQ